MSDLTAAKASLQNLTIWLTSSPSLANANKDDIKDAFGALAVLTRLVHHAGSVRDPYAAALALAANEPGSAPALPPLLPSLPVAAGLPALPAAHGLPALPALTPGAAPVPVVAAAEAKGCIIPIEQGKRIGEFCGLSIATRTPGAAELKMCQRHYLKHMGRAK